MSKWPMAVKGGPPVPWIALWDEEAEAGVLSGGLTKALEFDPDGRLRGLVEYVDIEYGDPKNDQRLRDHRGVLWMGFSVGNQGKGNPIYSAFHSMRQRKALASGHWRCQVCHRGMAKPTWVLTDSVNDSVAYLKLTGSSKTVSPNRLERVDELPLATSTAPTCLDCFQGYVQVHCPHVMEHDWVFAEAEDTADYAYCGDQAQPDGRGSFNMVPGGVLPVSAVERPERQRSFLSRMMMVEMIDPLVLMTSVD